MKPKSKIQVAVEYLRAENLIKLDRNDTDTLDKLYRAWGGQFSSEAIIKTDKKTNARRFMQALKRSTYINRLDHTSTYLLSESAPYWCSYCNDILAPDYTDSLCPKCVQEALENSEPISLEPPKRNSSCEFPHPCSSELTEHLRCIDLDLDEGYFDHPSRPEQIGTMYQLKLYHN